MPKPKNNVLSIVNAALSAAILFYVVGVEHRLTSLEVQVQALTLAIALPKNK